MARSAATPGGDSDGTEVLVAKGAEHPEAMSAKEPVAFYGLIALGAMLVVVVLALLLGAGVSVLVLVVALGQLYFTRKEVFAPVTVAKLLGR